VPVQIKTLRLLHIHSINKAINDLGISKLTMATGATTTATTADAEITIIVTPGKPGEENQDVNNNTFLPRTNNGLNRRRR
jgi:hypothetical protein